MGLLKHYHTVKPRDFPRAWMPEYKSVSEAHFRDFLDGKMQSIGLKKMKMLLEKGSVSEFLGPVIRKGQYQLVASMTIEQLNSMRDLSAKTYSKKLFGLAKNKDLEVRIGNQDITPFRLKLFAFLQPTNEIKLLEPSRSIDPDAVEIRTCPNCNKGMARTGESFILHDRNTSQVRYKIAKCPDCDGKWKIGFKFKDFLKYVGEFNEKASKINREIQETNQKAAPLIKEYNDTVGMLFEKITIWNRKCPYLADNRDYESADDYLKYWNSSEPAEDEYPQKPSMQQRGTMPKGYSQSSSEGDEELQVINPETGEALTAAEVESLLRNSGNPIGVQIPNSGSPIGIQGNTNEADVKSNNDNPLSILQIRLAKGEITKAEYEDLRKLLA